MKISIRGLSIGSASVGGPANLLTKTEDFANAVWTKSNSTINSNVGNGPTGTATADRLVPASLVTDGRVLQAVSGVQAGLVYTMSGYGKADTFSNMRLYVDNGASASAAVAYNLSTGAVATAAAVAGGWTGVSAGIQSLSDSWYRLWLTWTATGASPTRAAIWCRDTGDASSGILIWGAMLNVGALGSYRAVA